MERGKKQIEQVLEKLADSRFRRRFRLSDTDRRMVRDRGLDIIRLHGERFLRERLAPAHPANDGRQTPMRGHPIFVAQHATGTCCRGCLEKWHGIEKGKPLDSFEYGYVLDVIMAWIRLQVPDAAPAGRQKDLFNNPD